MGLNEAMEQAALAWLADRVGEVGQTVNQKLAGELADWLAQMPTVDRHAADAPKVDDGHKPAPVARMPQPGDTWTAAALAQPAVGRRVEVRFKNGAAWSGKFEGKCDVDRSAIWRYI